MDVELLQELVALNLEVSARLNIRRIHEGVYDIEGVRADLFWRDEELWVRAQKAESKSRRRSNEMEESLEGGEAVRLATYLRQVANVDAKQTPSDQIDAMAVAAAFAGITGGAGLTGNFGNRPQSPGGSVSGSTTPVTGWAPAPTMAMPRVPRLSLPGSISGGLSAPPSIRINAPVGLAGQAAAAFGGFSTPVPYRGRSPSIGAKV
eukprot:SRR837773.5832.p1 GENE.SRR837773.5832~~SRR837773.5832.p1  ORF type:complete len:223 (-),score=8.82 SRR837773.5832:74-691(-)